MRWLLHARQSQPWEASLVFWQKFSLAVWEACSAFWQFPVILDVRNVIHLLSRNVSFIFFSGVFKHSSQSSGTALLPHLFPSGGLSIPFYHPNCLLWSTSTNTGGNSHRWGQETQTGTTSSRPSLLHWGNRKHFVLPLTKHSTFFPNRQGCRGVGCKLALSKKSTWAVCFLWRLTECWYVHLNRNSGILTEP